MTTWGGHQAQRLTALCLAEYGTTCHLCGKPGANTADHLIARRYGGPNELWNLRPAHKSCNSSRGARPLGEHRARFPLPTTPPSRTW